MIAGTASINDDRLVQNIIDFAAAKGTTIKEESRAAMKSLVKTAIDLSPPAGSGVKGKNAQRAGEAAIVRDTGRMGFVPVEIKGFRTITQVYGRPLKTPIKVPTKINPKFADAEAIRRERVAARGGRGAFSRGGAQAYYVDKRKVTQLLNRLKKEVGRLASGWVAAAQELGVPVPAWIARHGTARGSNIVVTERQDFVSLSVTNHLPAGTEDIASDLERRIEAFKGYVANSLARQLKAKLAGKWGKGRG